MDNREKFNIKQMVDCVKQEPFYPATHAEAVKVIDNGLIKSLLDILGTILEFIRNFNNVDLTDLLLLGYTSTTAFPGNEGVVLLLAVRQLLPVDEVADNILKPVTSNAVYDYISNLLPNGEIRDNDLRSVSGDTVYDYIKNLIDEGAIQINNEGLVTGGNIFNYISNLLPNGDIRNGETKAVTGHKIWEALQGLEDNFWETDSNFTGSIKQKSVGNQDLGLTVSNDNEIAIGKYNISNRDTIFSVGGGTLGTPLNSVEVTYDPNNSLKIPYEGTVISVLEHIRNGLNDVKHITNDLFIKLLLLIADKWKASWTFSVESNTSSYLHLNRGINLKWHIKDSEGMPKDSTSDPNNVSIVSSKTYLKQNGKSSNINYSIQLPWSSYILNDYTINDNSLEFNFSNTGKSTFTFKMYLLTNEITPQLEKSDSVNLYAPSYIFSSHYDSILSIPNNAIAVLCTSLENFSANITINSGLNEFIYIALPLFIGIESPTEDNLPFLVVGLFEFNLQNGFLGNTTKTFSVCNKSGIIVNYKIVRSAEPLNYGVNWNIKHK